MREFFEYDLVECNTFGLHSLADRYVECETVDELKTELLAHATPEASLLVLGGGSNMLFNNRVCGTVLRLVSRGIEIVRETELEAIVRCAAGERWHDCVEWAVQHGLGGMENMALIPGTIGASPIQNIGAYGKEFKDVAYAVEYMERKTGELKTISAAECAFAYRDSVFKHALKNDVVITAVELRLEKNSTPVYNYKDVQEEFRQRSIVNPSIRDVFDAVVAIRTRKLPSPQVLGNAGSFFKNPLLRTEQAEQLLHSVPDAPVFDAGAYKKVPAAWLIEQCGLKGYRRGDAGVYDKHALVLVNHGSAKGSDIIELASFIQETVLSRFGIALEREVNVVGVES